MITVSQREKGTEVYRIKRSLLCLFFPLSPDAATRNHFLSQRQMHHLVLGFLCIWLLRHL